MAAPLLWEGIADDCVALIACHLAPSYGTSDLGDAQVGALESMRAAHLLRSVGAAHWLALNRACSSTGRPWRAALCHNRKWYDQAGACQRVLEIEDAAEDWPLAVLRLRASALHPESSARKLSHATPISKSTLRAAFRSVASACLPPPRALCKRLSAPLRAAADVAVTASRAQRRCIPIAAPRWARWRRVP
jgi:hypothetical protein